MLKLVFILSHFSIMMVVHGNDKESVWCDRKGNEYTLCSIHTTTCQNIYSNKVWIHSNTHLATVTPIIPCRQVINHFTYRCTHHTLYVWSLVPTIEFIQGNIECTNMSVSTTALIVKSVCNSMSIPYGTTMGISVTKVVNSSGLVRLDITCKYSPLLMSHVSTRDILNVIQ
jgi:hypothetical protein